MPEKPDDSAAAAAASDESAAGDKRAAEPDTQQREVGGPKGPEPTRYGDWEVGGRCSDF